MYGEVETMIMLSIYQIETVFLVQKGQNIQVHTTLQHKPVGSRLQIDADTTN